MPPIRPNGYDLAAARFAPRQDPYAEWAQRERELGYRYPQPYAVAAAEAARVPRLTLAETMPDVGSHMAVFPAPSVAGKRATSWGSYGRDAEVIPWDARTRAGGMSSRTPGLETEWDATEDRRRKSGRIVGTGGMTQTVHADRPYLTMKATASMQVRVTVGMAGGFEQVRNFYLGGGFTASFMLADYDTVKVEVLLVEAATTELQFAWLGDGLQAGDQTLYMPQIIAPADVAAFAVVPEGAYAVFCESNDADWQWDIPALAGYNIGFGGGFPGLTSSLGVTAVEENRVMGTRYRPSIVNNILWALRPI